MYYTIVMKAVRMAAGMTSLSDRVTVRPPLRSASRVDVVMRDGRKQRGKKGEREGIEGDIPFS